MGAEGFQGPLSGADIFITIAALTIGKKGDDHGLSKNRLDKGCARSRTRAQRTVDGHGAGPGPWGS